MISSNVKVWTTKGWLPSSSITVGDKVISYNPDRNCTEYDEVLEARQDYTFIKSLMGLKIKNVKFWITPDHPLMLNGKNGVNFVPIEDQWMRSAKLIAHRPFETYNETADIEELRWSARHAALYSRAVELPKAFHKKIWRMVREISGYEAQCWLEEFYRWNTLHPSYQSWMKSAPLKNQQIRDLIFHIAPRAGVGCCWWPMSPRLRSIYRSMRITIIDDIKLNRMSYGMKDYEGLLFDLKTNNKNYLIQYVRSVFLIASGL